MAHWQLALPTYNLDLKVSLCLKKDLLHSGMIYSQMDIEKSLQIMEDALYSKEPNGFSTSGCTTLIIFKSSLVNLEKKECFFLLQILIIFNAA